MSAREFLNSPNLPKEPSETSHLPDVLKGRGRRLEDSSPTGNEGIIIRFIAKDTPRGGKSSPSKPNYPPQEQPVSSLPEVVLPKETQKPRMVTEKPKKIEYEKYRGLLMKFRYKSLGRKITSTEITLVERSLSFMAMRPASFIRKYYNIGEESMTLRQVATELHVNQKAARLKLTKWERQFATIASGLETGTLDIKAWKQEHPQARNPLILLKYLNINVSSEVDMDTLREKAIEGIKQRIRIRKLPPHYSELIIDLYGLRTGVPLTTTQAGEALTQRNAQYHMKTNAVYEAEKLVLGIMERNSDNPAHRPHPLTPRIIQYLQERAEARERGESFLSNRALAQKLGVSPSLVNKIERKQRQEGII